MLKYFKNNREKIIKLPDIPLNNNILNCDFADDKDKYPPCFPPYIINAKNYIKKYGHIVMKDKRKKKETIQNLAIFMYNSSVIPAHRFPVNMENLDLKGIMEVQKELNHQTSITNNILRSISRSSRTTTSYGRSTKKYKNSIIFK